LVRARQAVRQDQLRAHQRKIIPAVGRELLGFIWSIGVKEEMAARHSMAA
jgi:hypothetical protein